MTNEDPDKVARTVEKNRMRFPIAIVKGTAYDRAYGVRGFPRSVLIDAAGNVVWTGHPATLPKEKLEQLLQSRGPIAPLPSRFEAINKLLSKREFGAALTAILKAREKSPGARELTRAQKEIEKLLRGQLEAAKTAVEAGHFGEAVEILRLVEREFAGLPAAAEAEQEREAIEAKPDSGRMIAAWRLLRQGLDKRDARDIPAARDVLQAVVDVYSGTHAAEEARKALAKL